VPASETSTDALARMMVGREVIFRLDKGPTRPGEVVLEVRDLSALNDRGLPALRGVSFNLRRGEIFGIAGVDGNGQAELAEVIMGLRPPTGGRIVLKGLDVTHLPLRSRIAQRLAYIPADRHRFGVIQDFSVADNLVLKDFYRPPFSRGAFLDQSAIAGHARTLAERFDIRITNVHQPVRQLSGGNQQKVVLAREASGVPDLLNAMQPTRGLDVGAAEFVLRTILAQRDAGAAVLYISTELEEVLAMSDRLAVLYNGEIMGIVRPREVSLEEISLMMAGSLRKSFAPLESVG